jgi:lysylphosphatidylglycerol synthetase-like protein (DUF2156 family)
MPTTDNSGRNAAPSRPFQFTLRTMFLVTTVVAVVLGGLSVPADWEWVRYLTVFYLAVAVPIILVVMLIYGRGYVRTFAIGALFPAGAILWSAVWLGVVLVAGNPPRDWNLPDGAEARRLMLALGTAIAATMVLLGGLIAVVVRRMVEPRRTDWDPLKFVRESAAGDETPTPAGRGTHDNSPKEGDRANA